MHRFLIRRKRKTGTANVIPTEPSGYGKRYREDCPLPEDAFLNSLFILQKLIRKNQLSEVRKVLPIKEEIQATQPDSALSSGTVNGITGGLCHHFFSF